MSKKASVQKAVSVLRQGDDIIVRINCPISFCLPFSPITRKFLAVFLRLLLNSTGDNVLKLQQTADLLEYNDRRDVDNFCSEFERKKRNLADFLNRKVDNNKLIPEIERFATKNILMPPSMMHKEFCRCRNVKLSQTTFNKYLDEVGAIAIIKRAQNLLWDKATSGNTVEVLKLLANQHKVPKVCDQLLKHVRSSKSDEPKSRVADLGLDQTQRCLLVNYLVGSNMNFSTIALLLNVSKTTVSNWFHGIKDLQSMLLNSIDKWSGKISIDEKFVRINGVPHYYISIVDFVTGIPLYMHLYPNTKKESFEACFRTFKLLYKKDPTLIVSDGSKSLAAGRKAVFPKVHYQLCKFHKMRNLFAAISKSHVSDEIKFKLKFKAMTVLRRKSVSGRKKGLAEMLRLVPQSAAAYISNNIIKQWRQLSKGLTSNVSERFNRKIEKVTSGRYGLKSEKTAMAIGTSLWLKVLIDRGRSILNDESLIASLNISRLCQENVDWKNFAHLFSTTVKVAA
ncbi:MAG: transposase [Candidatus Cloacimonetes bacterium]|nr:transposase [Candidatus Cloacimonadota bacterium]